VPDESHSDVGVNAPTLVPTPANRSGTASEGKTGAGSALSMPVRARTVLRTKSVWIFPLTIPLVLVVIMTFISVGAVLNPTAHLHGLPVMW
jgi:hypothetical protein